MGNYGARNGRWCRGIVLVKSGSKNIKNVKIIMTLTIVFAMTVFVTLIWVNDYYKATSTAKKAMLGNESVEVAEQDDCYVFASSENRTDTEKGIIFYPGGKVDEKAYAPLLVEFAEQGYEVYLVKMPAKLAIFGANAAEDIIGDASHIKHWTMMGHSLGGAMAADFSASHDENVDALVLLAAYSLEDLSNLDMDVYSFYGSEDGVLNMEKYNECLVNFPDDVIEEVIEGGNHAYYAHYGEQDGDGSATITREEQQEIVLDLFLNAKTVRE